jgi:hypothetical protein
MRDAPPFRNARVGTRFRLGLVVAIAAVGGTVASEGHSATAAVDTSAFVPAGPLRIMDTRDGTGVPAGLRGRGSSTDLVIGGLNGVPPDATAVALNATITESVDAGYVQLFPTGMGTPGASSNLNVPGPNTTIANMAIVPLSTNGS